MKLRDDCGSVWYDGEKQQEVVWVRILFICHGNICRSPMAEYIMKELVKREDVADDWEIESALSAVRRSAIRCICRHGASCLSRESRAAIMRRGR